MYRNCTVVKHLYSISTFHSTQHVQILMTYKIVMIVISYKIIFFSVVFVTNIQPSEPPSVGMRRDHRSPMLLLQSIELFRFFGIPIENNWAPLNYGTYMFLCCHESWSMFDLRNTIRIAFEKGKQIGGSTIAALLHLFKTFFRFWACFAYCLDEIHGTGVCFIFLNSSSSSLIREI